jgi:nicotinate-nucleotide pyrophosphorylase (carboxylating)
MDVSHDWLIERALEQDIGSGDVTVKYFVDPTSTATALIVARQSGVIAGTSIAARVFDLVDPTLKVSMLIADGSRVSSGAVIMTISGMAGAILTAERTALNFLQRLSGIASQTHEYVKLVEGTGVRILDTRKTTPGWRFLEKAAVVSGGGTNHRMGLYDRAMVKDNHLMACLGWSGIQEAIRDLKKSKPEIEVELEADRLDQVEAFLAVEGVDHILLDNMNPVDLRSAVSMRGNRSTPLLEASGGITRKTVREIAMTGVDFISIGALTHSVQAMDLAMDFSES